MKLRTPTHGYRMIDGEGKPKGKIHLLNPRRTNDLNGITVCKILIWPDDGMPCLELARVDAGDVCQRCLGPCEASATATDVKAIATDATSEAKARGAA